MSIIYTFILSDNYSIEPVPNYQQNFLELTNTEYQHFLIMPVILSQPGLYRELIVAILKVYKTNFLLGENIQPIIFLSSISWLDSFYGLEQKTWNERMQRFIDQYIYSTFLFNSSSWIQFVELEYLDGKLNSPITKQNYSSAIVHLDRIKSLNIFDNPNAKEYLEYHFRLQEINHLLEKSLSTKARGHGRHISPTIYSNERKDRLNIETSHEINFLFTNDRDSLVNEFSTKKINLRILLIDDKIVIKESNTDSHENKEGAMCKAKLIKDLMELRFDADIMKRVCWKTFYSERKEGTVKIFQFKCHYGCKECNLFTLLDGSKVNKEFKDNICKLEQDGIQIIAVPNLKQARILLADADIRFDLIMMDYLLDNKVNEQGDTDVREYSTEFWSDGNEKFFEISKQSVHEENIAENCDCRLMDADLSMEDVYSKIKSNRGPLQRLWIFPITAFNQTFIDDLRNKGVQLIDYYWYLSRGADPINTPYLFINTLNNFLQLQIQEAVFSLKTLITFLKKTSQDIKIIDDVDAFQAHMGSEYTVLIQKHGWRSVLSRDAKAGSLFSYYIWKYFYKNPDNRYLFRLMDKMQKFYHICTFADETDYDNMILYWKELEIYLTDYKDKLIEKHNSQKTNGTKDIIQWPDITSFRDKINYFLDKNTN